VFFLLRYAKKAGQWRDGISMKKSSSEISIASDKNEKKEKRTRF